VAGLSAEFGQFVTVGVGLLFGAFGAGAQVGAQIVAVAGGISARGQAYAASWGERSFDLELSRRVTGDGGFNPTPYKGSNDSR